MASPLPVASCLLALLLSATEAMAGTSVQNTRNPLPIVVPDQPYVKPPFSTEPSSGPSLPGASTGPSAPAAEELADTTQAILSACNLQGWQVRLEPDVSGGSITHVELSPTLDEGTVDCVRGVIGGHDFETDMPVGAADATTDRPAVPPSNPPGG
ncbi:hypothetical protein [Sphingomonas sp.]|uniref:hypothetical protein n=1 Tax=Sphingomonas sp. TaxID=28214 RepID=UPI003AFFA239